MRNRPVSTLRHRFAWPTLVNRPTWRVADRAQESSQASAPETLAHSAFALAA
jgi:hypothetical protein